MTGRCWLLGQRLKASSILLGCEGAFIPARRDDEPAVNNPLFLLVQFYGLLFPSRPAKTPARNDFLRDLLRWAA